MATWAGLDTDESSGQPCKEHDDFRSAKSPAEHAPSIDIGSVHLEDVLGDIDPDRANLHVDGPLM